MAEESDLERTEPASPKRLEQAREEGDVPRSRELSTFAVLGAAGLSLWMGGTGLVHALDHYLAHGLMLERDLAYDTGKLFVYLQDGALSVGMALLPFAVLLLLAALGSPLLIGGWLFSTKAILPNFERLNPAQGLGNLISSRAGMELLKAIAKTVLVGGVALLVINLQKEALLGLAAETVGMGSAHLGRMLGVCFLAIVGALLVIAGIDAPYQMWHYANKLKMTHQEVIQESKEANGNPQIKAKIRQQQREMARRRMMSEIPTADVVITNPTHFAVALKYTEGGMRAPRVVAKGADAVAARIREVAQEHRVPLLEAPPLARALHRHTELGDEIPERLYAAVAEVLAYVYQLKVHTARGGKAPVAPVDLPVPEDLDPQHVVEVRT